MGGVKKERWRKLGPGEISSLAERFRALGEPNRLRLIQILTEGEKDVGRLVARSGLNQANASRHLQTLQRAGILARRKSGLNVLYQIADPAILQICSIVCRNLAPK